MRFIAQIACVLAVSTSVSASTFHFTQSSEPLTFFSTNNSHEGGSTVTSLTAPIMMQGYHFAYWKLDGTPQRDSLSNAKNPFSFTILTTADGRAVYLLEWEDGNTNSLPDWWEWNVEGGLATNTTTDTDGDGFSLADEYRRDTNPRMPDQIADGGVSLGLSANALLITDTNLTTYSISSDPPGYVALDFGVTNRGTVLPQADAYGLTSGIRFACWQLNGTVVSDLVGCALGGMALTVQDADQLVAMYLPEWKDGNTNSLPDWWEWNVEGGLASNTTTDTDGDGFSLADEYRRDTNPRIPDQIADGGISLGLSANALLITDTNLTTYSIGSDPPGYVALDFGVTNRGTVLPQADAYGLISGIRFACWQLNGTVVTDLVGCALGGMALTVLDVDQLVAMYLLEWEDGNTNSLPDWWEWNVEGSLATNTTIDTDGDGFSLADEYRRNTNPRMPDQIADGGISLGLSANALLITDTNLTTYSISSDPPGYVALDFGVTNRGTVLPQADAYGLFNGIRFACWQLNGTVVTDLVGCALGGMALTVLEVDQLVAMYLMEWEDGNTNSLPDWWEWSVKGGLATNTTTDTDGDGFSLADEYRRDTNPQIPDQISDGGFSLGLSADAAVNFVFFPRQKEIMVNGLPEAFFTEAPPAVGTFVLATNSHPALGDWDGDGDFDLFVGGSNPSTGSGQVHIFENTGSPVVPNLVERTSDFAMGVWTNIPNPAPALGDWSGDGLADLAVGGDTNIIWLVESSGSWTGAPPSSIQLTISSTSTVPAFGDLNSDGWMDLLVLTDTGLVQAYTNTHTPTLPYSATPTLTSLLGTVIPNATGLTTSDVNGDGILDILISDNNGSIWEFHGGTPQ